MSCICPRYTRSRCGCERVSLHGRQFRRGSDEHLHSVHWADEIYHLVLKTHSHLKNLGHDGSAAARHCQAEDRDEELWQWSGDTAVMTNGMRYHRCCLPSSTSTRKRQRQSTKRPTRTAVSGSQVDTQAVCANRRSAPRTAAAGDSPRRLRGSPASAQLAVHCRRPARLRTTTAPRRGSVAAMLPHWSHGDRRLPDGRLTRPLPPPVKGHGRDAWCEYRSGTAGRRWRDGSRVRLPGQPASRLDPHALVGQVQRWPI